MKQWKTPEGKAQLLCLDMLKQVHILIAGTPGSGKSVLLNNFIYTALYKSPNEVKFILIDPKGTELSDYEHLPHTIGYHDEMDSIEKALNDGVALMESRFRTMKRKHQKESTEPHIYIIIDEWVDLKLRLKSKAETPLIRIAAKGRAAHIHVILCTQRPTRDIINGAIKANFVSTVALRTRNGQDSRNILGMTGCEELPMFGQCYYDTPAMREPELWEIKKIDDSELTARVKWWTDQNRRWWQL